MSGPITEQAAVLALVQASSREWYRTASVIDDAGSAIALIDGQIGLVADEQRQYAEELRELVRPEYVEAAEAMIRSVTDHGVRLVTVLDEDYLTNLQLVYNRPPFLWIKEDLKPEDRRAIAVVGTRQASEDGRRRAARLAQGLAEAG